MTFPFSVNAFKPIYVEAITTNAIAGGSLESDMLAVALEEMSQAISTVRDEILFNQGVMQDALSENQKAVLATIGKYEAQELDFDAAARTLVDNLRELTKAEEYLLLPDADRVQAEIISWSKAIGLACDGQLDEWTSLISLSDGFADSSRTAVEIIESITSNFIFKDLDRILAKVDKLTNDAKKFEYAGYAESVSAIAEGAQMGVLERFSEEYNRKSEEVRQRIGTAQAHTHQSDLLLNSDIFAELRDVASPKLRHELDALREKSDRCKVILKILASGKYSNTDLDAELRYLRLLLEATASGSVLRTNWSKSLGEGELYKRVGTTIADCASPALANSAQLTMLIDDVFHRSVQQWLIWLNDPEGSIAHGSTLRLQYEETLGRYHAASKGLHHLSGENLGLLTKAGEMKNYKDLLFAVQASEQKREPKLDALEKIFKNMFATRPHVAAGTGAMQDISTDKLNDKNNPFENSTIENFKLGAAIHDLVDADLRADIQVSLVKLFNEMDVAASSNISLRDQMIEGEKNIYEDILRDIFGTPAGLPPHFADKRMTPEERKNIFTTGWASSMSIWERENGLVDTTRRILGEAAVDSFISKRKISFEKSKVVAATQRVFALMDTFIDEDPRRPNSVFFGLMLDKCANDLEGANQSGGDQPSDVKALQTRIKMQECVVLHTFVEAMAEGWAQTLTDDEKRKLHDLRKNLLPGLETLCRTWLENFAQVRWSNTIS